MAKHLPGKVAQLIGDFRTIAALVAMIEHEMEKRIVARHGWVKLDSLVELLPRLKNQYLQTTCADDRRRVTRLEELIEKLRKDVEQGPISNIRDAMVGHSLQLDLQKLNEDWRFMGATTFGVLESDLDDIDGELVRVSGSAHVSAGLAQVAASWPLTWRHESYLGDPARPRAVSIYPALATANVVSLLGGGDPAQDATLRAVGLATFMRQTRILMEVTSPGSVAQRLFAEILVNDYFALWEVLFLGHVRNDYGTVDVSVLEHWQTTSDPWEGAECLAQLGKQMHANYETWRTVVRNKISAHLDANIEIWKTDIDHWPMTLSEFIDECRRVVKKFYECALIDMRSRAMFIPPVPLGDDVIGLSRQSGRLWDDN